MAYNQNIPQPTDLISQSQSALLANFQAIQTLLAVNHGIFGAIDEGKHKWVTFPNQGSAPATGAGEVALYSQNSTLTSTSELVFRRESNGTSYEFTSALASASGWARLPSGILLKWGNFATVPGSNTVSFPVAATIPVFSSIFQVLISTKGVAANDSFVLLNSFTTTDMTVYSTQRTSTTTAVSAFTYLAIGI